MTCLVRAGARSGGVRKAFSIAFGAAALILASSRQGLAQSAPPAATPAPAPSTPVAGWQNGFFIQSPNGDNRLQVGIVAQLDGRFSLDDVKATTNTFGIRKARVNFSGRIAKYFDYRVMPDFGGGTAALMDADLDLRVSPKLRVRSGKDKTPIGYELLIQDAALLFPERSLASNLVPGRDIGVQAQGDLAGGVFSYAGGVFNGIVDGVNSTADVDTNSGKDLAGRITWQPFRSSRPAASALNGLGVHVGGSTGSQIGALPSFRTSLGTQTFFSYAAATNTTPAAQASGTRIRFTPAVFYYYKSLGAFGEYTQSTQAVTRGTTSRDISNHGWDVSGAWLLTGESASAGVPTPKQGFDPPTGHWGALQVLARYAELSVDPTAFDAGFAAANASQKASATTIAVNWYPVQYVKYYIAYEHTSFEGPTPRPAENIVLFRVQLAF